MINKASEGGLKRTPLKSGVYIYADALFDIYFFKVNLFKKKKKKEQIQKDLVLLKSTLRNLISVLRVYTNLETVSSPEKVTYRSIYKVWWICDKSYK